jgi:hypothetical protein
MTSPLEAMAKSWAESEDAAWENQLPEDRAYMISVMRAALLALAEADMSDPELKQRMREFIKDRTHLRQFEFFRAMLRAIAEDQA